MRNSNTSRNRRYPRRRGLLLLVTAAATFAMNAYAVDPDRGMSQYMHDRWETEQGFPRGTVYAIAQTADGYLWIGTEAGLVRFDGWKFRVISDHTAGSDHASVFGLTPDRDGSLWVRLPGPMMFRYREGVFTNPLAGTTYANVTASAEAIDGSLLAAAPEQGTFAWRHGRFEMVAAANALPRSSVTAVAQTSDGAVWIGTRDAGLFRISGGRVSSMTKGLPDPKVNCLLAGAHGDLWIGTDNGVVRWSGSELTSVVGGTRPRLQVLAMARDRDQNLWIGTDSRGLLRINDHGVTSLHVGSSPSSNDAVTALFEDREGSLWVGSGSGLERLRDSAFLTYSRSEGLPADGNSPIFVDSENRVWLAPIDGGLWWLKDNQHGQLSPDIIGTDVIYSITGGNGQLWLGRQRGGLTQLRFLRGTIASKTYKQRDGLAENNVYSVYQSRDGSLWAGTLSGGVSRFHDGRFTTYRVENGLASNTVFSIVEDSRGTMWFATPDGLSSLSDGRWRTFRTEDGLPSPSVNCLLADSGGVLWAGTAAGIAFRTTGSFQAGARTRAALHEQILGVAEDRLGSLWISTSNHVLRVNRDHLLKGALTDQDIREYGIADGLRGVEGVRRDESVTTDSLGRIWFSMRRGISVIDPGRLENRAAPAMVHVQSISADGKAADTRGAVRIAPGKNRITLAYTATVLAVPERIRFRYRLDGFDHGWSEPLASREAVYTNLAPGSYRFRVSATNADGVWDSSEADLAFEIQPRIWQAAWFRAAAILTCGLCILALYRLRLHRVTHQLNMRFEERLAERTRIAQELHDTLLQGFLSASMQLHVATDRVPEDSPEKPSLRRVLQLIGHVIEEGRNAVRGLRSPDAGADDLGEAFSRVPQEIGADQQVDFRIILDGQPRPLHSLLRDDIYRIGREALVNAFRHSHGNSIEMQLEYGPKRFRFLVRDDGCGINPAILETGRDGHWGLRGMRERAERIGGRLHVWSRNMAGTEVEFSMPSRVAFEGQTETYALTRFIRLRTRRRPVRDHVSRSGGLNE